MTRTEALARAQTILTGTNFSKEDASRVRALLAYATGKPAAIRRANVFARPGANLRGTETK